MTGRVSLTGKLRKNVEEKNIHIIDMITGTLLHT